MNPKQAYSTKSDTAIDGVHLLAHIDIEPAEWAVGPVCAVVFGQVLRFASLEAASQYHRRRFARASHIGRFDGLVFDQGGVLTHRICAGLVSKVRYLGHIRAETLASEPLTRAQLGL
jgi:hypothetical protein